MKNILYSLAVCLMVVVSGFCLYGASVQGATNQGDLTGYAWSSNIGWVSFDGSNYGVAIGPTGVLSGYAWSSNIGWISFNLSDLSGCPTGICSATFDGNKINGWAKALSANGNGWDGWIKLSSGSYGFVFTSGSQFHGYAWGGEVIGWIKTHNLTLDESAVATCFNGIDDDNDGYTDDYDNDCTTVDDPENDPDEQCSNDQDDDSDGTTDYGADADCTSETDTTEGVPSVAPIVELKVGIETPSFDALNLGKEGGDVTLGVSISNASSTTLCSGNIIKKSSSSGFAVTPATELLSLSITGESARIVVSCTTGSDTGSDDVQVILKKENEF